MQYCLERVWQKLLHHNNGPRHAANDWSRQSQDLNITEAVWDHLGTEQDKSQPTSKQKFSVPFKNPGEPFLKIT